MINTRVVHPLYGIGVITAVSDKDVITVNFPGVGEKRFQYPGAFCKSIQSEDSAIQEQAEADWLEKEERRRAEEAERNRPLTPEEMQRNIDEQLSQVKEGEVFDEKTNRIFIVHQGLTFGEEYKGGYVWAPASGIHHHERLTNIHKGDIIFNYAGGEIQAVSEALSNCFNSPRPSALSGYNWGLMGYRVQIRYQVLSSPQSLASIVPTIIRLRAKIYSSFDCKGNANQGYMYELENAIAQEIKNLILKTTQPSGVKKVLNRI